MGAFEHQGGPPVINSQPDNLIACEGEEVTLAVEITDTAVFQWQKDGMDLPGANSPVFSFNSITTGDQGSYRCVIWNAYDTVNTTQANIVVYAIPVFQGDWQTTWAEINEEIELRTYAYGTSLNYQWQKDGTDLPGENLPGLIFTPAGYEDEGIYRCIASNSCGSDTMKSVPVYLAPQICMVTVDPATGNNLVVWEKNSIAPISYYKIYRESQYAGIYDPLATIPYDDLSVLMDSTADPVKRAYLYKITAVDTAGHETDIDLCRMHKTIHLLVTTNPETKSTQLDWDRYVGFEYGRYEIFRSDTTINFTSLDIMSSSISTYTDTYSEDGIRYYRVAAIRPDPCYPSGTASRKADAGPYSHSMSNLEDNRLQTFIRELPVRGLSIYPNPFSEYAMIHFDNPEGYPYTLYLMNLAGKVLRIVSDITSSQYEVAKSDLDPGIYFVELRGTRIFTGKLVIE